MQRGITGSSIGLVVGLVVGLGAAALAGCVANGGDESIVVLKNVAPTSTTGGCMFSSQESEVSLVRGTLDVSITSSYVVIAQVKSRITAAVGQESQRTVFTRGANVDITFPDATLFSAAEIADLNTKNALHFMQPFTAPISPNGGVTDVLFELIPRDLSVALSTKLTTTSPSTVAETSFTVVGDLAGGNVSSQKFQYTVTITNGGLQHNVGPCSSLPASFMPHIGSPCNAGQDGSVDCCSELDNMSKTINVCPAMGTGM
jgi:hypothetical protein